MPKSYVLIYNSPARPNMTMNPASAFATSDYGKMIGLTSGYVGLLSTVSTSIDGFLYSHYGILRGLPDGTCTAKSTQRVVYTPIRVGDTLKCLMSSNFSTSGTPAASSDVGKSVGLTQNGPHMPGLSTAGTLLTQGALRAVIAAVPSTGYVTVQVTGLQTVKLTTA